MRDIDVDRGGLATLGTRLGALRARGTILRGRIPEIKSTIAAARSSLISLQDRGRETSVPAADQAAIGELGPPLLAAAQQLTDLANDIAGRFEAGILELTTELGAVLANGDVMRGDAALILMEQRTSELEDRFDREMRLLLNVVTGIGQQLAVLDRHAVAERPVASLGDEIRKLSDLHRGGILSDEEFAAAKQRLIR